ncbi:MAG: hypothetical protein ACE37F_06965 [Nannocystaceae bacterium]|nr:hypothetical protein [bacterium]
MSHERNADSVLFSLDTLEVAQQDAKASQGASRQMARLAAAAPASGGSGLIDIKDLAGVSAQGHAPTEPDASGHGSASASASSSAAVPNLLSRSSMLGVSPTPDAATAVVPAKAPSRAPLIVLSVLAVLALAAAITAIVLRG